MNQGIQDKLIGFLYLFPVLLISVALHEFAHCWTGDRLGDDTPRRAGRVTLNPLAHLDPLGTFMMVVTSWTGFGFGWGKPSPMNPNNFRHPARDRMIGALAGPFSNILQMLAWASLRLLAPALLLLILPRQACIPMMTVIDTFCSYGVIINAFLAVFNLLPIFPLDGHHVLSYIVPSSLRPMVDNPLWGLLFLVLVFTGALGVIAGPVIQVSCAITQYLVGWSPQI